VFSYSLFAKAVPQDERVSFQEEQHKAEGLRQVHFFPFLSFYFYFYFYFLFLFLFSFFWPITIACRTVRASRLTCALLSRPAQLPNAP